MNNQPRKQRAYIRGRLPNDPRLQRYYQWLPANRGFYASFREWLNESSYGSSALSQYSVAVRYALAFLQKPYWTIDPDQDLPSVLAFCTAVPYHKPPMNPTARG